MKTRYTRLVGIFLLLASTLAVRADDDETPRYSVKTLNGERFTNESLKGKVVFLQFWTTWCPHCREQQEIVDRISKDFASQGVVVLAVDVNESKKKVLSYLKEHPRESRIVLTEDTNLAAWFAAKSYPLYVVINRDGNVSEIMRGAAEESGLRNMLRHVGVKVD